MKRIPLLLAFAVGLLAANQAKWTLRTDEGFAGTVTTNLTNLSLTTAQDGDATNACVNRRPERGSVIYAQLRMGELVAAS